jgi:cytochrome P450
MTDTVATETAPAGVPSFDVNIHEDEHVLNPYPLWKQFRDAGPVVWLAHHGMYALPRHAEVVEALTNHEAFGCGHGVGMNDLVNSVPSTLMMDPPEHDRYRRINGRPLLPKAVRTLEPQLRELAEKTVLELKERGSFDGVKDLASVLPLGIIAEVIGLPDDGRERLQQWAADGFDSFGLLDDARTQRGLVGMAEAAEYMESVTDRLKPGSWGDLLQQAEKRGEIEPGMGINLMNDYIYPALDTTIMGLAGGLRLFSEHPDQWDRLREDRSLMRGAISEVMRLCAPIQWFTRLLMRDYEMAGVTLPEGSRAVVIYASANRDERKFVDPERFDIGRKHVAEQVGWGKGKHACTGMPLARLEMHVVFNAMADHVERIETGASTVEPNTTLYGLNSLEVTFR